MGEKERELRRIRALAAVPSGTKMHDGDHILHLARLLNDERQSLARAEAALEKADELADTAQAVVDNKSLKGIIMLAAAHDMVYDGPRIYDNITAYRAARSEATTGGHG